MKIKQIYRLFGVLLLSCSLAANAWNLPKRTIGNTEFYCYKVQAKETIFGIAKKFNITQDDLKKYNPAIVDGLKKDYVLFIPVNLVETSSNTSVEVATDKTFTHVVAKGETLYGLSKTYNVSQEDIIAHNPTANTGIKTGQTLIIPQPESSKAVSDSSDLVYHTIAKGETLYSLSKRYNTTIEKILSLNPGVSPTNFKVNTVLKIEANSMKPELTETETTAMKSYVAQDGDNFKSIAKAQGISETELKSANPNTSKVRSGQTIQIPVTTKDSVLMTKSEGSEYELNHNESERIKEIYDSVHDINANREINVALMLPYMLNDTAKSKQADLYTEYYKGFLLAVKEINSKCDNRINIHTYDTQNNLNSVKAILGKPEMQRMDVIFAADGIDQLNEISKFSNENKVYFVNTFSVKSENYTENPYAIQINIPQAFMQAEVCDWFDETFADYSVIFVHKKGNTKKDIANDLKTHLEQKGKQIQELEYKTTLTYDVLSEKMEEGHKYLVIPTSGTKAVMSQIVPAIKRLNTERADIQTSVLGYPEWVIYMDDWRDDFHAIDTYFYTRFFANPENSAIKRFEEDYTAWYGEKLLNAAPKFGFLGYDTGKFFLETLCENGRDFSTIDKKYEGLQSAFDFERISNWSGFVNKSVFFVHLKTDNSIETTIK